MSIHPNTIANKSAVYRMILLVANLYAASRAMVALAIKNPSAKATKSSVVNTFA